MEKQEITFIEGTFIWLRSVNTSDYTTAFLLIARILLWTLQEKSLIWSPLFEFSKQYLTKVSLHGWFYDSNFANRYNFTLNALKTKPHNEDLYLNLVHNIWLRSFHMANFSPAILKIFTLRKYTLEVCGTTLGRSAQMGDFVTTISHIWKGPKNQCKN